MEIRTSPMGETLTNAFNEALEKEANESISEYKKSDKQLAKEAKEKAELDFRHSQWRTKMMKKELRKHKRKHKAVHRRIRNLNPHLKLTSKQIDELLQEQYNERHYKTRTNDMNAPLTVHE